MSWQLPRALVFDWDDTLVDTGAILFAARNRLLAALGRPAMDAAAQAAAIGGRSARDVFPALFGDAAEEARRLWYAAYQAEAGAIRPQPGAAALLARAAALGCHLAVVSNKRGDLLRAEAAALGWSGTFAALVGAGDASADKPDPAPVALALAGLSARENGRVWLVGDAAVDMDCARAAGCHAILIAAKAEKAPPAAERIVPDCTALASWLEELAISAVCAAAATG